MSEKKENDKTDLKVSKETQESEKASNIGAKEDVPEKTLEEKLLESEEKLLRSLAEIENQRRRFEKDIKDAFEFGSFNFAKESLSILDNLQRAKEAIKNDEILKTNKDLDKFLENITIIEKDLISMSEIEDDKTSPGSILQEIQSGYMLGDRLLRPVLVTVAKKKSSKDQENKDKKE